MPKTAPIQFPDLLFINGKWLKPSSSDTIDVVNSGTEELFVRVAEANGADTERAVAAARNAFDHGPWPQMSHKERADFLKKLGAEVNRRAAETALVWTTESGMLHSISRSRAQSLGAIYEYYADLAQTFAFQEQHKPQGGGVGLLVREPVGVVGAIIPWNAPANLIAYKLAPALIAGCSVIIKASPEAPGAAYLLAEACDAIGLPPGVVNVLTADRAASEMLVRHPGIDKITFTGSTAAGRRIASLCGERIARCTLELGGKSAAVIMSDFDIETAAKNLAGRAVYLTGQVCSSLTRIIVNSSRHDALVDALSTEFRAIRVGDPFDGSSQMGPLATRRQRDRVEQLIETGKAEGATLATGGGRPSHMNRGFYVEPTVFGDVDNNSTLAREEIFGPVLSVIRADSDDHAITLANDSIYGLNAAVFTNDLDTAYRAARRLRSGSVGQNGSRTDFNIAFGGFKQSGLGREGGIEGLLPYLETKTVVLDGLPSPLRTIDFAAASPPRRS